MLIPMSHQAHISAHSVLTYDSMFYGPDLRNEEASLRHVRAGLKPKRGARRVNLRPERDYMRLGMAELGLRGSIKGRGGLI